MQSQNHLRHQKHTEISEQPQRAPKGIRETHSSKQPQTIQRAESPRQTQRVLESSTEQQTGPDNQHKATLETNRFSLPTMWYLIVLSGSPLSQVSGIWGAGWVPKVVFLLVFLMVLA